MSKTPEEQDESILERQGFTARIVNLAVTAEAAWEPAEIASALLVAHIGYARRFMAHQDIAAALRQVADTLPATAPTLPPELH